ncbi:hypothetical protein GCK32_009633, partial [Trichostrongylus colubriformis]
ALQTEFVMHLYTPADGLFRTHVTWEDIEEDMQRELSTSASFGSNKSVKDVGEGNGFMSKLLLIYPDWQNKDKELPDKFLAKILSPLAVQKLSADIAKHSDVHNRFADPEFMDRFEAIQKRCHNAEVTTYSHLIKIPKEKTSIPKIYYMRKFDENNPVKGYILMEYLENIKGIHIFENISLKEVRKVSQNILKMFRSLGDGRLTEKADQLEKVLPDLIDIPSVENIPEELGMERVLCHGDLWSMNVLWRQSGEELKVAAIVDYQIAHFGCPASDLVRMFSASLSGKDRRAHWEELLEDFYGYLKNEMGNEKMPYTLEQMLAAFNTNIEKYKLSHLQLTMSLFTPADGIMKTNVQWDDLQESVIEAFGADAIFGPNKQVKDVGCGNGFMSKICLVSPDWQTKMKDVPERFIVKISSQLPLLESQGLDETGHFTSEEFAKKFEDDVKRVYFTKKYSDGNPLKGYIIMEYISDGVPYHIFDNLKPESMQQVGSSFVPLNPHLCSTCRRPRMEKVLCHGDLWSTNMIWRKGAKDVELAAVIDFQGAHYGNPTVDIVRVMCACMSGKDRREHWESLLEKFYSYLQEELENRNMPYTLDMLKEAYQRYFPLGAFLIVPMIGPMFQMVTTSGDVDYKAKVQEVVFEKVECLLDDIWKMHNENKQHSTV